MGNNCKYEYRPQKQMQKILITVFWNSYLMGASLTRLCKYYKYVITSCYVSSILALKFNKYNLKKKHH